MYVTPTTTLDGIVIERAMRNMQKSVIYLVQFYSQRAMQQENW